MLGGFPIVRRVATSTAVLKYGLGKPTAELVMRNLGAAGETVRVYFSLADATADLNYITLPVAAAINPNGEWRGNVRLDVNTGYSLWFKAASGTPTVEVVGIQDLA